MAIHRIRAAIAAATSQPAAPPVIPKFDPVPRKYRHDGWTAESASASCEWTSLRICAELYCESIAVEQKRGKLVRLRRYGRRACGGVALYFAFNPAGKLPVEVEGSV